MRGTWEALDVGVQASRTARASEWRCAAYVVLLQDMAVIRCVLLPTKMKRSFGCRGQGSVFYFGYENPARASRVEFRVWGSWFLGLRDATCPDPKLTRDFSRPETVDLKRALGRRAASAEQSHSQSQVCPKTSPRH